MNIEIEQKFNQKYNNLEERWKTIELVLKSPNLNKITKNIGVKENSPKEHKEKIMKKLNELLSSKKVKTFLKFNC